ncbi:unnamed protein product [Musa acuminata subsp. malaccensis]|uniref:(wild Malaysian banana) hypothetical protein n=1 Tax=Musa acuminata subsp. malaccensis TaxID=214687 RepID=A0A804JPV3_MUSAM|nr:unnamed protein product [Musa acuminata subsp. malaccensis]
MRSVGASVGFHKYAQYMNPSINFFGDTNSLYNTRIFLHQLCCHSRGECIDLHDENKLAD